MNKLMHERLVKLKLRWQDREPDFIVGTNEDPYLHRWYITPWRGWLNDAQKNPTLWNRCKGFLSVILPNVYLHKFMRDDDDSALHDHPWFWCSYIIENSYIEHTIAQGGIHRRRMRAAGSLAVSHPWRAHRVELLTDPEAALNEHKWKEPCWTIFITWLRLREWGFHCPERGWVHWKKFTNQLPGQNINKGCEQ